jgi:hypothetical protein
LEGAQSSQRGVLTRLGWAGGACSTWYRESAPSARPSGITGGAQFRPAHGPLSEPPIRAVLGRAAIQSPRRKSVAPLKVVRINSNQRQQPTLRFDTVRARHVPRQTIARHSLGR